MAKVAAGWLAVVAAGSIVSPFMTAGMPAEQVLVYGALIAVPTWFGIMALVEGR